MELYALIMAGGVGSRFWPRSKEKKPKQLIRVVGNNTMIQDTVKRLEGLVENKNIIVITNKVQKMRNYLKKSGLKFYQTCTISLHRVWNSLIKKNFPRV